MITPLTPSNLGKSPRSHLHCLFGVWLISLAGGGFAQATTVSFTSVADTSLYQDNSGANLGATTLLAGQNYKNSVGRALFQFDISSIPSDAVITEAHVTLAVVKRPDPDQHGGPVPSDFNLYRMLVSWGEGTGSGITGSPAKFGEATWTSRFYPLVTWDSPGGTAGVDYADSPSSSAPIDGVGIYTFQSTQALIDDVTMWVTNPADTNFGFMLISSNELSAGTARRFASKEQSSGGPPPTLTITYDVPEPSAGLLAGIALAGLACFRRPDRRQVKLLFIRLPDTAGSGQGMPRK